MLIHPSQLERKKNTPEHRKNMPNNTRKGGKKPFFSGFGRLDNLGPDGSNASNVTKIG